MRELAALCRARHPGLRYSPGPGTCSGPDQFHDGAERAARRRACSSTQSRAVAQGLCAGPIRNASQDVFRTRELSAGIAGKRSSRLSDLDFRWCYEFPMDRRLLGLRRRRLGYAPLPQVSVVTMNRNPPAWRKTAGTMGADAGRRHTES